MDLSLETRNEGDHTIVEVAGEIDVYTAPKLREALIDLVNAGNHHIVVDVERVEFLDSTGLGVLVGALKRYRTLGGDLHLVISTTRIQSVFELTGLTAAFRIHDTVGSAVEAAAAA